MKDTNRLLGKFHLDLVMIKIKKFLLSSHCDRRLSTKTLWKAHELTHIDKQTGLLLSVEEHERKYPKRDSWQRGRKPRSPNKAPKDEKPQPKSKRCPKCGRLFQVGDVLSSHIEQCEGIKGERKKWNQYKYPCPACGKNFVTKTKCAWHMQNDHNWLVENIEKFCFVCKEEVEDPLRHAKSHNCAFPCPQVSSIRWFPTFSDFPRFSLVRETILKPRKARRSHDDASERRAATVHLRHVSVDVQNQKPLGVARRDHPFDHRGEDFRVPGLRQAVRSAISAHAARARPLGRPAVLLSLLRQTLQVASPHEAPLQARARSGRVSMSPLRRPAENSQRSEAPLAGEPSDDHERPEISFGLNFASNSEWRTQIKCL